MKGIARNHQPNTHHRHVLHHRQTKDQVLKPNNLELKRNQIQFHTKYLILTQVADLSLYKS